MVDQQNRKGSQYEDNNLKYILTGESYLAPNGADGFDYHSYLRDHLGSVRLDFPTQQIRYNDFALHYFPFGMEYKLYEGTMYGSSSTDRFNGKEDKPMFGQNFLDYVARQYNSLGRFMSIDPLCEKYYSISPYAYCLNNPVKYVDPTGKDVWVKHLEDGTYEVVGGTANDDLNIYTVDAKGNRTDNTIGQTLTAYSFHGEDGVAINGAIINPLDNSGADFLNNEIIGANLSLTEYMPNATGGQPLDFKRRGIEGVAEDQQVQYMYRGMPLNDVPNIVGNDGQGTAVYGSARDVGNVAAGYVAGSNGLTWQEARAGFVALETLQHMPTLKVWREGQPTQRAERVGWGSGNATYWMNKTRRR